MVYLKIGWAGDVFLCLPAYPINLEIHLLRLEEKKAFSVIPKITILLITLCSLCILNKSAFVHNTLATWWGPFRTISPPVSSNTTY